MMVTKNNLSFPDLSADAGERPIKGKLKGYERSAAEGRKKDRQSG